MKRFLKFFALFGLIILTTGCGSQFKDEASVTIDAEQIILAAIKAKRNAREVDSVQEGSSFNMDYLDKYYDEDGNFDYDSYYKDLYGDDYEDMMHGIYNGDYPYGDGDYPYDFPDFSYIFDDEPTPEMIEAFNEFFEYSINFECSIEGDKVKAQKKSFTIPFSDFMELENNINFAETEVYQSLVNQAPTFSFNVVVGKRIRAHVKMTINMVIKDEDAFIDYIFEIMKDEKSGVSQDQLEFMEQYKDVIAAEMLSSFEEEMEEEETTIVTGVSKEIIVQEGINELEVVITINPYDGDTQISKTYTIYYYQNDNERPQRDVTTNIDGDSLDDFIYSAKEVFDGYVDHYSGSSQKVDKLEIVIDENTKADWLTLTADQKTALCEKLAKIKEGDEFKVKLYLKDTEKGNNKISIMSNHFVNGVQLNSVHTPVDKSEFDVDAFFEELEEKTVEDLIDELIDQKLIEEGDYEETLVKIQIEYGDAQNQSVSKEWLSLSSSEKQAFKNEVSEKAVSLIVAFYITRTPKTTTPQITVTVESYNNNTYVDSEDTEIDKTYDDILAMITQAANLPSSEYNGFIYSLEKLEISYNDTDNTKITKEWLKLSDTERQSLCNTIVEKATAFTITIYNKMTPKDYASSGTIVIDDLGLFKINYEITTNNGKLYINEGELLISVTDFVDNPVNNVSITDARLLYGGRDLNDFAEEGNPFYTFDASTNKLTITNTLTTSGNYQLYITAKAAGSSTYTNSVTLDVFVENTVYYEGTDYNYFEGTLQDNLSAGAYITMSAPVYLKLTGEGTTTIQGTTGTLPQLAAMVATMNSDSVVLDLSEVTGITAIKEGDCLLPQKNNLVGLILPETLETIGEGVFGYDFSPSGMEPRLTLEIGSNVNSIGVMFVDYTAAPFKKFVVSEANTSFATDIDGTLLMNKDKTVIVHSVNTTTVSIPDSVTEISNYAFSGRDKFQSIYLNNVEIIGTGAFYGIQWPANYEFELYSTVKAIGTAAIGTGVTIVDFGFSDWYYTSDQTTWTGWIANPENIDPNSDILDEDDLSEMPAKLQAGKYFYRAN